LQEITKKQDTLREQDRRIHSHIIKEAIDKTELFIMNEDLINALGQKASIERLI
jgi:hypothetical protein